MNGPKRIAIVGGGISGLASAHAVRRMALEAGQNAHVVLYESEPVLGGKITTQRAEGFVVESGPHGFLDKEPTAMALVSRLGLEARLRRADEASANRFVLRAGRLRKLPASPPAFLAGDILPLSGKLRVVFEPFVPRRKEATDESVYDFARRRIGRAAAEVLVDAMVTGIYGGDPKRLSLPAAFPRMRELEDQYGSLIRAQLALSKRKRLESGSGGRAPGAGGAPGGVLHSFDQGLGVLIDALAQQAGAELRLDTRVERLERAAGTGFFLTAGGRREAFEALVLTAPAPVTASLLDGFGYSASEEAAKALRQINYANVTVVVHGFQAQDLGRSLDGFGFLVPNGEGRQILGSIWASTVFAGHAPDGTVMLRTLLGGARHPEYAEGDDEALSERVLLELRTIMGLGQDVRPSFRRVIRWPAGIPQYELGHLDRVRAVDRAERDVPGLFIAGNAVRGVAMVQCVKEAERVASGVVKHLFG